MQIGRRDATSFDALHTSGIATTDLGERMNLFICDYVDLGERMNLFRSIPLFNERNQFGKRHACGLIAAFE